MENHETERSYSHGLAQALRLMRDARDLTQAELARRVGIDRATMNRYEGGSIKPGVERLAHILEVLKMSWSDLGEALEEVRRAESGGKAPAPDTLFLDTNTPDDDLIAAYLAAAAQGKADEFVDAAVRKTRHLVRWRKRMKQYAEGGYAPLDEEPLGEDSEDPARLDDLEDLESA